MVPGELLGFGRSPSPVIASLVGVSLSAHFVTDGLWHGGLPQGRYFGVAAVSVASTNRHVETIEVMLYLAGVLGHASSESSLRGTRGR